MKVLFIYCNKFGYNPTIKTLDNASNNVNHNVFENVQVAFIQAEKEDEENEKDVEKKLVKNLKWICGKNKATKIVLHSFAHLSDSKADPDFTIDFLNKVEARMINAGYTTNQTPFGYFLDLQVDAPGFSLARVFKSI